MSLCPLYVLLIRSLTVWRIVIGLSLIPAFGTLYQRLTLPESRRFQAARQLDEEDPIALEKRLAQEKIDAAKAEERSVSEDSSDAKGNKLNERPPAINVNNVGPGAGSQRPEEVIEKEQGLGQREAVRRKKAHFREFLEYFSEWRHLKILIGTCSCWFFLDIA